MAKQFSLIKIENRLQKFSLFCGASGVVFIHDGQLSSHPPDLAAIGERFTLDGDRANLEKMLGKFGKVRSVIRPQSTLILINPSETIDDQTLEYFCQEMEEDVQFCSVFDNVFEASVSISSNLNLNPLLNRVMGLLEEMIDVEVSAVILLDPVKKELYWEISRGDKSEFFLEKVTIPLGEGVAGSVALTGESVLLNDVRKDARWSGTYDEESGFQTRSMICVPIRFHGEILGVIEVINKKRGSFTLKDLRILEILAAPTGAAIENARIHGELERTYEDLKVLDKAKKRIIDHLSHEMKTPLAIISAVLERVSGLLDREKARGLEKTIKRGQRNLVRLLELQSKIDDIIQERKTDEQEKIVRIIEDALSLLGELKETDQGTGADILEKVTNRLESLYGEEDIVEEAVPVEGFLQGLCDEAISQMQPRKVSLLRDIEKGLVVQQDRDVLRKVCGGLLKNAIENTPDGGKIEVLSRGSKDGLRIHFRDYGVGITPQNQKMIFGGFFHTQETALYSSKRPYQFNAGGSGSDLLRARVFSERFGFFLDFESTRCGFIPDDTDQCPGRISDCPHIQHETECFASGQSTFAIRFPIMEETA